MNGITNDGTPESIWFLSFLYRIGKQDPERRSDCLQTSCGWLVANSVGKLRTKPVSLHFLPVYFSDIIFELLHFLMILVSKRNTQSILESTINV